MRLNNFLNSFAPDISGLENWEFRKYRVFVLVCFVSAFYAIIYIPQIIVMEYYGALYVILLFALINLITPFLLKNLLPLNVLVNIYIATMAMAEVYIMYISGGVYHTATDPQILAVPMLMALFFFGYRQAFFWFFVGVTVILVFGVLQANGVQFIPRMNSEYVLLQTVSATAGHLLIIFMVVNIFESEKNKSWKELKEKNKIIAEEKKRSDELLLNILPAEVMEELKETGKTTAHNYDLVTVLFADFVDFTNIIEELPPEELVAGIDTYFGTFDSIVEKYGVEKIKTVGDAYICASGLPLVNMSNPTLIIDVALEMMDAVETLKTQCKAASKICFDIRIGIHSGPVVAGVVGVKKFAYDIWGDTVNTAARMQQCSEPGKINISNTTYDLVKHRFACAKRGKIEAKHKGLIDMYFVEKRK